ncbi:MAG: carbon-nitrogen family hydrolase [Planctomycetes bacterium]|nr:carbon-nitrogen family hydrolase [Planctomycetota bacterium]
MKVALLQWDIAWEKKEQNYQIVERLIAQAKEKEPDLVVLPEMFATGFSMHVEEIGEAPGGPTFRFLHEMARKHRIYIVGGLVEKGIDKGRNVAVAFDPEGGLLGKYGKIHPFSHQRENRHYEAGNEVAVFEMGAFKTAIFLCFDLRFPELFRCATFRGATLFVVPANWPSSRSHHWQTLLAARAIENQAYCIGVNRTGKAYEELAYPGMSMVVDPTGQVVATGGQREGVVFATIDAGQVENSRKNLPFLEDARPKLYAALYQPLASVQMKRLAEGATGEAREGQEEESKATSELYG